MAAVETVVIFKSWVIDDMILRIQGPKEST